jgi:hypothetical protein
MSDRQNSSDRYVPYSPLALQIRENSMVLVDKVQLGFQEIFKFGNQRGFALLHRGHPRKGFFLNLLAGAGNSVSPSLRLTWLTHNLACAVSTSSSNARFSFLLEFIFRVAASSASLPVRCKHLRPGWTVRTDLLESNFFRKAW